MIWEPTTGYKMSNEENTITFQRNADGIFLISDYKRNKAWFVKSTEKARSIWREYQKKGYKRI